MTLNTVGGVFRIEELPWDSRHFGIRMGVLAAPEGLQDHPRLVEEVAAAIAQARAEGFHQVMARATPHQVRLIHALEALGFRLVDTLVTLELDLSRPLSRVAVPDAAVIREGVAADAPALMAIARRAFTDTSVWLDRFHADPRIPQEQANELYAQWVKNSVAPAAPAESMADCAWVVQVGGHLAGFLTCRVADGNGVVSLNAVEAAYRRQGLYAALVQTAVSWFRQQGCRRVQIRTNLVSHGVLRTWQRLGAVPVAEAHTFHWWASG